MCTHKHSFPCTILCLLPQTQLQTRIQSMTDIIIKSSSGEGIAVEPSEARVSSSTAVCMNACVIRLCMHVPD